jgi:hypothetical protein
MPNDVSVRPAARHRSAAALLRGLPLADGRVAIFAALVAVLGLGAGLARTIALEQTRDWTVYEQAAARLVEGKPLYLDRAATTDGLYLYPPAAAALWAVVGSPEALLAAKLAFLCMVGTLALVVTSSAASRLTRWLVAAALIVVAVAAPPELHDFALGNVMAFYIGAVALSVAVPGWLGAVPLGVVCAVALKPVIGPYLLWLFISRRSDAVRVAITGLAVSVVVAAAIGPERYVEYLSALPGMSSMFHQSGGNIGLSAVAAPLAVVGLIVAYVGTVFASRRLSLHSSAAVAIAAGLLAQPTLGFNYLGLLIPAAALLWSNAPRAGLAAIVVLPPLAIVSAPLAAALVMVLAFATPGGRPGPLAGAQAAAVGTTFDPAPSG